MATLTLQEAGVKGLASVVFSAASALGDDAATGPGVMLLIRNGHTAAQDVIVDTPGTVRGLTIENPTLSVPSGSAIGVIPMITHLFGATAAITYSAVIALDVALVRIAR